MCRRVCSLIRLYRGMSLGEARSLTSRQLHLLIKWHSRSSKSRTTSDAIQTVLTSLGSSSLLRLTSVQARTLSMTSALSASSKYVAFGIYFLRAGETDRSMRSSRRSSRTLTASPPLDLAWSNYTKSGSKRKSTRKSTRKSGSKRKANPALRWIVAKMKELRKEHPGEKFTWYGREAGRLYRKAHGKATKSARSTRSPGVKRGKRRMKKAARKAKAKAKKAKAVARAKAKKARAVAKRKAARSAARKRNRMRRRLAGKKVLNTRQRRMRNSAARHRRSRARRMKA